MRVKGREVKGKQWQRKYYHEALIVINKFNKYNGVDTACFICNKFSYNNNTLHVYGL